MYYNLVYTRHGVLANTQVGRERTRISLFMFLQCNWHLHTLFHFLCQLGATRYPSILWPALSSEPLLCTTTSGRSDLSRSHGSSLQRLTSGLITCVDDLGDEDGPDRVVDWPLEYARIFSAHLTESVRAVSAFFRSLIFSSDNLSAAARALSMVRRTSWWAVGALVNRSSARVDSTKWPTFSSTQATI